MPQQTFRAEIGDRTFDIVVDDDGVSVNGAPVACCFDAVGAGHFSLLVEGRSLPVVVEAAEGGQVRVNLRGRQTVVRLKTAQDLLLERFGVTGDEAEARREVHAPMPGLVLAVLVEPGQAVCTGDGLVVLEAMKMENELRAPADGVVNAVHVVPGEAVGKNDLLIEFE